MASNLYNTVRFIVLHPVLNEIDEYLTDLVPVGFNLKISVERPHPQVNAVLLGFVLKALHDIDDCEVEIGRASCREGGEVWVGAGEVRCKVRRREDNRAMRHR